MEGILRFYTRCHLSSQLAVSTLVDMIKKDVDHSTEKTTHLRNYSKYQIALPSLDAMPTEFMTAFHKAIVDCDMKDDLERSGVINWCRTTKRLLPLKTTADGNCLMHAVSQALWGIEDSENFLRRLIYCNIVMDRDDRYRKRWLLNQKQLFTSTSQQDFRLNTEEYNVEWENVISATEDVTKNDTHGLPYTSLEAIHLYVLANTLKRPIIVLADKVARNVFGQSIQQCHIGGIYLPLDISPRQCHKSPLVIGYSMNHFTPLVFEQNRSNGHNALQAVPLVSKSITMLEVKFALPEEMARIHSANILQDYLKIEEAVFDAVPIPVAVMNHSPLPETVNIIDAYTRDCQKKFRDITDPQARYADRNMSGNGELAGNMPLSTRDKLEKCVTAKCPYLADPNLQGLCSRCFKDFTIQYAKQEEAKRKILQKQLQNPLPPELLAFPVEVNSPVAAGRAQIQPESPGYHDLSMMGEECRTGCGFKCSSKTFPYCHECYPKYAGAGAPVPSTARPMTGAITNTATGTPDLSLMPDQCCTINCRYKCSKATTPYCHECYAKHRLPIRAPTAPPPTVAMMEPARAPSPAHVHYPDDETAVVSLRDRNFIKPPFVPNVPQPYIQQAMAAPGGNRQEPTTCRTIACDKKPEKANDGYCENCYQLNLYDNTYPEAIGNPVVCLSQGCTNNITVTKAGQCSSCFIQGKHGGDAEFQLSSPSKSTNMNIVPTPEEKILNFAPVPPAQMYQPLPVTAAVMRSIPSEHDETAVQLAPTAMELQSQKYQMYDDRKYICSTAGCTGMRMGQNDFCDVCLTEHLTATPMPEEVNLEESNPLISESPVPLTKQQIRELNPVVLSSKDKVKCSYVGCENMIYPPKKLCDECTALLDSSKARKSRNNSRDLAAREGESKKCKTKGCEFYGSKDYDGLCSSCYKGNVKLPRNVTAPLPATNKLVKAEPKRKHHSAPLNRKSDQENTAISNQTNPVALNRGVSQPSISNKGKAQLCIVKGCDRYGDPIQGHRCSQHYMETLQHTAPISEESIAKLRPHVAVPGHNRMDIFNTPATSGATTYPPGNNYNKPTTGTVLGAGNHNMNGQDKQFLQAYEKLESSRKCNRPCRNSGCQNYGNPSKEGYCNTCYTVYTQLAM